MEELKGLQAEMIKGMINNGVSVFKLMGMNMEYKLYLLECIESKITIKTC